MFKKDQLVAADIGYGFCNLEDGLGNTLNFRSCVVPTSEDDLANYSDETGKYLVGDKAILYSREQRASTDTQYFDSERFRILLLYGLQELAKAQGLASNAVDWVLTTGLPIEFYSELKDSHTKRIQRFSNTNKKISINKVIMLQQPMGTLWNKSMTTVDGASVKPYTCAKVGVVDIGDGTTDIIEGFEGKLPDSSPRKGLNEGCSNIHEAILSELKRKYRLDSATNVHLIDRALRTRTPFDVGKDEIDLYELKVFKDSIRDYLKKLSPILESLWQGYNTVDYIIITGGGAKLIPTEDILKHTNIPQRKLMLGSSSANASGYMNFLMKFLVAKKLMVA